MLSRDLIAYPKKKIKQQIFKKCPLINLLIRGQVIIFMFRPQKMAPK